MMRFQVDDGALMRWAPRVSVLTDDGTLHALPDGGVGASEYVICGICNATMSKTATSVALMRLGCCFKLACAECFGTLWGIKPTAGLGV
jgi:hypothetical protein